MSTLAAGTTLDQRYELVAPTHDRGLGETWEARDQQHGARPLAVKFLRAVPGGVVPKELADFLKSLRAFRNDHVLTVINQGVWDSLSDDQRALMEQIGEDFFDKGWEVARTATDEGIERNTSQGVEFVETAAEWKPRLQEITKTVIVPGWVSRVGPGAQQLLDDVVAPRLSWSLD